MSQPRQQHAATSDIAATSRRSSRPPPVMGRSLPAPTILKLGGSLVRDGAHHALLEMIMELAEAGHALVIVPGGGAFADAVRRECGATATSSTAAHWMAILAMDQMAYLLAGQTRSAGKASAPSAGTRSAYPRVVRSAAGIARAIERGRVPVLAPFRWLRTADPLPHTWDVTSDSIAAWIAARLQSRRLILLKSVDGICDDSEALLPIVARTAIEAMTEPGSAVVDPCLARALAADTACWIINGRRPERLRELVAQETTTGTMVGASSEFRVPSSESPTATPTCDSPTRDS